MSIQKTSAKSLVTVAPLVLVTVLCLGLATKTYFTGRNTSSFQEMGVTVAVMDVPSTLEQGAIKVVVPEKVHVVVPEGPTRMDKALEALSMDDAYLYRVIFQAQKEGDWGRADRALASLTDKRLTGLVLADRYQRRGGTADEMNRWMALYGDLPEAEAIQALAVRQKIKISEPRTAMPWPAGYTEDSAADFRAELKADDQEDSTTARLARAITKALRRGNPDQARDLFVAPQGNKQLAGTFVAEAEAAIAASYYYEGERDQATSLSQAAAGAQHALGLWVRGLIAWERDDVALAATHFSRLADHPSLTPASRAAASFWAYRSLRRVGESQQAFAKLEQAARQTRSFYGILASQLMGRDPVRKAGHPASLPKWDREQRAVLAAHPEGWRALALIQVGEVARAEMELRRLNPLGQGDLQQAMMALAGFVPMPALVVQLASLTGPAEGPGFDTVAYPILPWMPKHGYQMDRALVFALVRHESQFDPRAMSAQGARGLMQIMPATARGIEGFHKDTLNEQLFDPSFNLALGQRYVRQLTAHPGIGDNLMLILAAYNGGPNKVARWREASLAHLDAKHAQDPLLFLETIPVRETRGYITRVMTHYWGYQARLGKEVSSLRLLAEGQWPRIDLTTSPEPRLDEAHADDVGTMQVAAR